MRNPAATGSAPVRVDLTAELETHVIRAMLDTGQWTLHGRRHRIFVLVWGTGSLSLGGDESTLSAPCLVWIPAGQAARLTLRAGARGAWLALSEAALAQVAVPGNIAEDLRRLARRPQLGTSLALDSAERMVQLLAAMQAELVANAPGAHEMIRHQLVLTCIQLWRLSDLLPAAPAPTPRTIVANFLQLVDQQMRNHWSVADYARYLGVSTDRLNSAVQRATGRSPLVLIHARLITEARQMLEGSGLQIAEIAALLGFEDAAYFSRFFRRVSGKSPRAHRAEFAHAHARASGSFAAWP